MLVTESWRLKMLTNESDDENDEIYHRYYINNQKESNTQVSIAPIRIFLH